MYTAFIRHGEFSAPKDVAGAWGIYPLTDDGKNQAKQAALDLLQITSEFALDFFGEIYTSDILRARQTADIISIELKSSFDRNIKVTECAELRERSFGGATNLSVKEIESLLLHDECVDALPKNWKRLGDYKLPVPGSESLSTAGKRVFDFIEELRNCQKCDKNILYILVGHAGAFRYAAHHMGVLSQEEADTLSLANCSPILFQNKSNCWHHVCGEWSTKYIRSD